MIGDPGEPTLMTKCSNCGHEYSLLMASVCPRCLTWPKSGLREQAPQENSPLSDEETVGSLMAIEEVSRGARKAMTAVNVEGSVVKCSDHWHARVVVQGRKPLQSAACATEDAADEVLRFASEVVMAVAVAGGGQAFLTDDTERVQ
ncbi:MAG TPA: hypothetical protein VK638_00625 [Edaphobacter sp.]|nr:hypothetical protein [Edaphobacter sp.]